MAKAGDEIVNPVTGHKIVFRESTRDTDGELLSMEWIGGPGWRAGPVHVHSFQEERFRVLSGTLGSHVAGEERTHGPDEEAVVVPAEKFAAHKQLQATAKTVHLGDTLVSSLLDTRDVIVSRGGELRNPSPSVPL